MAETSGERAFPDISAYAGLRAGQFRYGAGESGCVASVRLRRPTPERVTFLDYLNASLQSRHLSALPDFDTIRAKFECIFAVTPLAGVAGF
jgi:hypothetical protein